MTFGTVDIVEVPIEDDIRPVCRFCWGVENASVSGGELLAPCRCDGSMRYIHRRCLQQWQKKCLQVACQSGSHSSMCSAHLQAVTTCSICKQRYKVPWSWGLTCSVDWQRLASCVSAFTRVPIKRAQLRWLIPCLTIAWLVTFTWESIASITCNSSLLSALKQK
jgi:hypothetical protein